MVWLTTACLHNSYSCQETLGFSSEILKTNQKQLISSRQKTFFLCRQIWGGRHLSCQSRPVHQDEKTPLNMFLMCFSFCILLCAYKGTQRCFIEKALGSLAGGSGTFYAQNFFCTILQKLQQRCNFFYPAQTTYFRSVHIKALAKISKHSFSVSGFYPSQK